MTARTLLEFTQSLPRWLAGSKRGRVPFVAQLSATECGAACLAMVLRYYGRTAGLDELRERTVSSRDATNAQLLIEEAERHGMSGRAVTLEIDQLHYLSRGAVLHWNFSHFVVFDGLRRDGVDIVDPASGRRRISMEEFRRAFTGVAIIFEPNVSFKALRRSDHTALYYLREILGERGFLPHILVSSLLMQLLGLATPLGSRLVIDRVIPQQDYGLLTVLIWGAVIIMTFQTWTSMVRSYLLLYLRTRLDSRMTLGFLSHLLDLPFDFFQRRSAGDLLMRLGSNSTVREILTSTVLSAILDGTLAVTYLFLLIGLSPATALLTAGLAILQIILFVVTRRKQRRFLSQALEVQGQSQSRLMETLSGIETLKSMGLEQRAAATWASLYRKQMNVALDQGRLNAKMEAAGAILRMASNLTLLGLGTRLVLAGKISLGDMIAVNAIAAGFLTPLMSLISHGTQLQQLSIYLERLSDVLKTPSERDRSAATLAAPLKGEISVDGVTFRYGAASPLVIDDVSLRIKPGEFIALVGRSGSGKSTLARLLVGLYAPATGRVCFDGRDLLDLDIASVRRQIGVVTQQPQLFAGTIRSNIAFANPDLPMEHVIAAARQAHLHFDIVAMPMAYETILVDRGTSLSGGQQQRLALARALAGSPALLVLDEATNQLDAETERQVQASLAALNCTRIVIAHRLSTIMAADRILVMDRGRIVEAGSHAELLRQQGRYTELVSNQISASA